MAVVRVLGVNKTLFVHDYRLVRLNANRNANNNILLFTV